MRITSLTTLVAFGALATLQAKADLITYSLGIPNTGISGYTGPYATVDVDRTSTTTATITFTSLTQPGLIYLMGDGGSVGLNVNGPVSVGTVTAANSGGAFFSPGAYTMGGAGNEDGFGSFNLTINSFDGYQHSASSISFGLTLNSGTWVDATSVLTANGSGYLAASHIFVANVDSLGNYSNSNDTGFAANGAVPEPTTVIAGALLLLPFGASTLRILRKNRTA